jgi:hypothetical protein
MKPIKRIFILLIAAVLGATIYGKVKAVDNVATNVKTTHSRPALGRSAAFEGGIGPVGNPYAPKGSQKKIY